MRTAQLITLGVFGLFAVLTAFFQLRAGMKSGEQTRADTPAAKEAGARFARLAGRCAIGAVLFLVLSMVLGAVYR